MRTIRRTPLENWLLNLKPKDKVVVIISGKEFLVEALEDKGLKGYEFTDCFIDDYMDIGEVLNEAKAPKEESPDN